MQKIFEKIKERLMTGYDKESNSPVKKVRLCDAIEIVNQVAEECATDTNVGSRKLLDSLHEKILKSKFAEEVTEAEIEALVKTKELTNNNQSLANDGWIPCSEKTPEFEIYAVERLWVTMHRKGCNFYFVRSLRWNGYQGRWEWDNGVQLSDRYEVVAWRQIDVPGPYKPKGE